MDRPSSSDMITLYYYVCVLSHPNLPADVLRLSSSYLALTPTSPVPISPISLLTFLSAVASVLFINTLTHRYALTLLIVALLLYDTSNLLNG